MARFKRTDKTAYIARQQADAGTQASPESYRVVVTINATSTATGATNWVNPHPNAVAAKASVFVSTAGTGTFDLGTGTSGTGANAAYIDGGTLAVGFLTKIATGTDTIGTVGESAGWLSIAANGNGGDSVVLQHSDTPTSTAVGYLIIDVINPVA